MEPSFGAACWSWVPAAGWLQMARSGWVVGRRHAAGHERQGGWASAVPGVLGGSTAQAGWTRWCLAERVCCGPACRFAHTDANEGVNSGDRAKRILARWRPAGGERVHAVRGRRTAGQPRGRPITEPILPGFPDLGQNSFYEYGAREGVPRILDLLDKHAIKMTSFMSATPCAGTRTSRTRGRRARPQLAAAISAAPPAETERIADSVHAIEQATGTRPSGYNNYWIRPGVNTLEILQELGFIYRRPVGRRAVPAADQRPAVRHRPVLGAPQRHRQLRFPRLQPAGYEQQMIDEFDQLYAEAATRRRMMVIGPHERLSGHASRVRVLDRILTRLRDHDDVWWARKDQIAQWVLDHPGTAAWVDRDPAPLSGEFSTAIVGKVERARMSIPRRA
jgi:peptidoglycan/xylan/chitin deacetylase (PgdA/CDA1 family)